MPVGQSQSYNFAINSHMRQCDDKQQEDTCKGQKSDRSYRMISFLDWVNGRYKRDPFMPYKQLEVQLWSHFIVTENLNV